MDQPQPQPGESPQPEPGMTAIQRGLRLLLVAGIVLFGLLRFWHFTGDFPEQFSWDGDAYTDEGFYAYDAINFVQDGVFYIPLDYNQFIALPLMPLFKGAVFSVFGANLAAARLVTVLFAVATALALYYLMRRFEDPLTALFAVFLLAINHLFLVFSRVAIDEVPVTFWVTLSFALAVRVRGEKWRLHAILLSIAYAAAVMTKTNAVFAAPLLAVAVILQELDPRRIALKFLLCSAVFLSLMGVWYATLIRPHAQDFFYFFTLNVDIAKSNSLEQMFITFSHHVWFILMVDPILPWLAIVFTPLLLVLWPRFRRHPLLYLALAWHFAYLVLYAYYGRFYPRFFMMALPPLIIWTAIAVRAALEIRGILRVVPVALVAFVALSCLWQMRESFVIAADQRDTFNAMAADILRHVDSDPSGNRVVMGHAAGSVALRIPIIPRHDRYSPHRLDDRLRAFQPRWVLSEGEFRTFPLEPYFRHPEFYELLYDIELVESYDTLENFKGHKMHLYRLTPRAEVPTPRPFARASLPSAPEATP